MTGSTEETGEAGAGASGSSGSSGSSSTAASKRALPRAARWRRRLALVLLVGAAVLGPLWLRVAIEGSQELSRAERARAEGDEPREIEHLGRALRWRAPLLDHDELALERLWAIGEQRQAAGAEGREAALAAYREVRRGLLATRTVGVPHRARWDEANARIAALMVEQERALGLGDDATADAEAFHRQALVRVPGPEPIRATLAALAFVAWIGAVVGFSSRGLDGAGRLRPRPALRWGLGAVAALLAWAVLLALSHTGA
ncbi:MAG: hypothetical protein KDK70_10655 [Myxococcales bacterium]|nr:hypothetical protein [Myxococcales bacterium]